MYSYRYCSITWFIHSVYLFVCRWYIVNNLCDNPSCLVKAVQKFDVNNLSLLDNILSESSWSTVTICKKIYAYSSAFNASL